MPEVIKNSGKASQSIDLAGGKKAQPAKAIAAALPDSNGDVAQLKLSFDKLTELSSTLMDAGELDVYSIPREVLV